MHIGCGTVKNSGFDAAFIHSLATQFVTREANDSDMSDPKSIYKAAQEDNDGEIRRMGNDHVSVRIRGKYYTISEEDYDRIDRGHRRETGRARYQEESAPLPAETRFDYVDTECLPASGNERRPAPRDLAAAAAVSRLAGQSRVPVEGPAPTQATRPTPPPPRAASPRRRQQPTRISTNGQTAQAALQSALSALMSGNTPAPEVLARLSQNGKKVFGAAQRALSLPNV